MFHRCQARHQLPLATLLDRAAPLQQDSFLLMARLLQCSPALLRAAVPQKGPILVKAVLLLVVPQQGLTPVKAALLQRGIILPMLILLPEDNPLLREAIIQRDRFPPRVALLQPGTTLHTVVLLQSDRPPLKLAFTRLRRSHSIYRTAVNYPIASKVYSTTVCRVYGVASHMWGGLRAAYRDVPSS